MNRFKKFPFSYSVEGERIVREQILKEHPNPRFQRSFFISLNGEYKLEENRTELIPFNFKGKALVPFAFESLLSGFKIEPKKNMIYHLEKSFIVDEEKIMPMMFLNVLRVDGEFSIYINGKKVCYGINGFNIQIDISEHIKSGENTIDFSIKKIGDLTGVTGQVYIDGAKEKYIKDVYVVTDRKNEEVEFRVKSDNINGKITLTTPNGLSFNYKMVSAITKIKLDEIDYWTPEQPFFYQYKIDNGDDSIRGTFSIFEVETGVEQKIPCLLLNGKPISVKGLIDDYFYSDSLVTMPSGNFIYDKLNAIKRLGFNAIRLTSRRELPFYYHALETVGLMFSEHIKENKYTPKYVEYIRKFSTLFLVDIEVEKKEELLSKYEFYKKLLDNKLVVTRCKNIVCGDLILLKNQKELKSIGKNKKNKKYLLLKLGYKKDFSDNFKEFIDKNYIQCSMNGLVGFFYESYNNPKNGIFKTNMKSLAHGGKKISEYIK